MPPTAGETIAVNFGFTSSRTFSASALQSFAVRLRVLEHQRLLQEHVGMQTARQDEMAFEQRAGFPNSFKTCSDVMPLSLWRLRPAHAIDRFDRRVHA